MYASPEQCHALHVVSNTRSVSTTLRSKRGTLREDPPAQMASPAKASRAATIGLKARDIRKPLTIQVRFVGNGDCEWVVEARGKRFKFAGCENVHECLARLSRAYF